MGVFNALAESAEPGLPRLDELIPTDGDFMRQDGNGPIREGDVGNYLNPVADIPDDEYPKYGGGGQMGPPNPQDQMMPNGYEGGGTPQMAQAQMPETQGKGPSAFHRGDPSPHDIADYVSDYLRKKAKDREQASLEFQGRARSMNEGFY